MAIQTTSSPANPAGWGPTASAMALSGMPSAMEPRARTIALTGLGGFGAGGGGTGCGATGRAAAWASLASTRASISRPTRSTNDSRTASRYSDGSSL